WREPKLRRAFICRSGARRLTLPARPFKACRMDTISPDLMAPSLDDIGALARTSFATLPQAFRRLAGDIQFRVTEFPEDEVLADLGVESPFDILGLFQGVGMAHASAVEQTGQLPNQIWL